MTLKYKSILVTSFAQNCSIVWCDKTQKGVVIDPGGDAELIEKEIDALDLKIEKILLTHGHLDHVGGALSLQQKINIKNANLDIPIIGPHEADKFWFDHLAEQGQMFGFGQVDVFLPQQWLKEGDQIQFGEQLLDVLHTPGHTPGHIIFYHANTQIAFVGDVLFKGAIGRTDFPKGDHGQLLSSIKQKLWPLGEDVRFISGHGAESTFGQERKTNPFVAD